MGSEIRSAIVARREVAEATPPSVHGTLSRIRIDPDMLVDLETRMGETQHAPRDRARLAGRAPEAAGGVARHSLKLTGMP